VDLPGSLNRAVKGGPALKPSKFTEEHIAFAVKQAQFATLIDEVCRKMGISDATFYNRRKKCGGLPATRKRQGERRSGV
jgi:putative transposase